jgi:hypothetical protein
MLIYSVVMAGTLISAGFTSGAGSGIWAGYELLGAGDEAFSVAVEGRFLFPSRVIEEPSGRPFDLSALSVALVPCLRWGWILGCAVADGGFLFAGGGRVPGGSPIGITLGAGPRLALQFPLSDFNKRLGCRIFADLRFSPIFSEERAPPEKRFAYEHGIVSGLFGVALTFN